MVDLHVDQQADGAGVEPPALVRAATFVASNWRLMLQTAVAGCLIAIAVTFIMPRKYDATVAFTPSSKNSGGGNLGALAGVASQVGMNFDLGSLTGGSGDNVAFYAALIRSPEMMLRVINSQYTITVDGVQRRGDLIRLLEIKEDDPTDLRRKALEKLDDRLTVRTNPQANIVEVKVTTKWPDLSEQIADRIWRLVNEFNVARRQSQASAERAFLQSRADTAAAKLAATEATMAAFLQRNRVYQSSPELSIVYEKLRRQVDLRSQLYATLLQNLDRARTDEVRNTPVITAINLPAGSAVRQLRGSVLAGYLGFFFGALIALAIAALRNTVINVRRAYPTVPSLPWRRSRISGT